MRLILVSHRLPFVLAQGDRGWRLRAAGGLASVLEATRGLAERLWLGWPGDLGRGSEAERASLLARLRARGAVPVGLTSAEVHRYHGGFSHGVLWPLFHYQIERVNLDAEGDWQTYREVNLRFAEAIAEVYQEGDRVWVQDYQLMLVPQLLRKLRPEATIGYFLHVPFPSPDVFRILPWRAEVLEGILGADVVGFHTAGYRHNFAQAAAHVLGAEPTADSLVHEDRRVHLGVYPIGVEATDIERAATSPEVEARANALRGEAGKKIVLGVDRLDYTKGIPRRLLAFERLLERTPALRDKVTLVQLAAPSREGVKAYTELRRSVNELVGRINSHLGTATSSPIRMLYRSVGFEELLGMYRAADVMLVTPLRDGMNLVAKEYVASRVDEQGALVLSEFAGAAVELRESLVVNPYDLSAMAQTIAQAIEMPPEEQRLRMRGLRQRVLQNDARRWASSFLDDVAPSTEEVEQTVSGVWLKGGKQRAI